MLIVATLVFSSPPRQTRPTISPAVRAEGIRLYERQRFSLAAERLARFVADHPRDNQARRMLAESYLLSGKTKRALSEYLTLARRQPRDADVQYQVGLLYRHLGVDDEAAVYLKRATGLQKDQPLFHAELAKAYRTRGRYREAIRHWREVLERTPEPPAARAVVLAELGDTLLLDGSPAEAKQSYDEGLLLDPGNEYLNKQVTKVAP